MTRHAGFLADILEHPADDAPRLIYADWLEERGDPDRGEFIRLQVELARPPWRVGRVYDDPAWLRLHARERELLNAHHREWLPPPVPRATLGAERLAWEVSPVARAVALFHRGFVAEVTLPCQAWLEHGPALARAAPLERVTLSDRQPSRWYRLGWGEWYWVRQAGPTPHVPDRLPPELCALLSTGRVDEDGVMTYLSRERAQDALSRACLGWARDAMVPGRREGV
jgi:uncharacterized protein (TIGR02996 family)